MIPWQWTFWSFRYRYVGEEINNYYTYRTRIYVYETYIYIYIVGVLSYVIVICIILCC